MRAGALRGDAPGIAIAATVFVLATAGASGVVGFRWDDGIYRVAGESLASGTGYHLPNRVGDQSVPQYPPGYPLIVAAVHTLTSQPRAATVALGLISALCVAAASLIWWRVLRRELGTPLATLCTATSALCYETISTGESQMSDAPFALLVAVAAALGHVPPGKSRTASLIAVAALAPLLRSAGIALALAIAIHLLRRRETRLAAASVAATLGAVLVSQIAFAPASPSYADLFRAAWGPDGRGWERIGFGLVGELPQSAAAFVVPPLVYSGAVRRLAEASMAGHIGFAAALAGILGLVLAGGVRRWRAGVWSIMDWALMVTPPMLVAAGLGMDPRYYQGVGAVLALWFAAGIGLLPTRVRTVVLVGAALAAVGAGAESARHAAGSARLARERRADYLATAATANAWLGGRGTIVAEFSELLWIERRIRAAPLITVYQTVLRLGASTREVEARMRPLARGCLLHSGTFAVAAPVFAARAARPGAIVLRSRDRGTAAVCWTTPPPGY